MNDYLLDADGDLLIVNGDWAVGESTYQHQRQLIKNAKGDYKANPTICVDAENFVDGKKGNITRAITKEFMQDGMEVVDLTPNAAATADNLFNNAYYI
jgi:hypothetical protein